MKIRKYYLAGFIALISLILVSPASIASLGTNIKSAYMQAKASVEKPDAKATVLAKGQNHLPKRTRTDC